MESIELLVRDIIGLEKQALVKINGGIEKEVKSFALPHIRKLMEIAIGVKTGTSTASATDNPYYDEGAA